MNNEDRDMIKNMKRKKKFCEEIKQLKETLRKLII